MTYEDGHASAAAVEKGPRGVPHFQASTQLHAQPETAPTELYSICLPLIAPGNYKRSGP